MEDVPQKANRRRRLNRKEDGQFKGGDKGRQFNNTVEIGSIKDLIAKGDKPTLKRLGLTHDQAKRALKEWEKQHEYDAQSMEKWYRYEVRDLQGYRGRD